MSKSNSIIPAREITAGAEKASPLIPARTFDRGQRERLSLQRTVVALRVPEGTPVDLPEGDEVILFQALGGSFSIEHRGQLYRIDGTQADALGREPLTLEFNDIRPGEVAMDHVDQVLRTVYDPEIPVNLLDLGLIYDRRIEGTAIHIDMTLTAPACGMGEVLKSEVEQRLRMVPNVTEVRVRMVFDPPWDRSMLSEIAKLELGML